MFEGAPAAQVRAGAGLRQFQRCARSQKSMGIFFLARSTIARLILLPLLDLAHLSAPSLFQFQSSLFA